MRLEIKQMAWFGVVALALSVIPSIFFLTSVSSPLEFLSLKPLIQTVRAASFPPLNVNLNLSEDFSSLSIGKARDQISFSMDPPRPDSNLLGSRLMIRLPQSKQIKRVELPARVDLEFSEGILRFSERSSRFWLICSEAKGGEIAAALFYETPEGVEVASSNWVSIPQETPVQSVEEFLEGTSFRELGESRWWGHDVFSEKYANGEIVHRIEVGPPSRVELLECSFQDWLVFKGRKWQKVGSFAEVEGLPIAHLKGASSQGLEIEGWEGTSHIRIRVPLSSLPPLKMRGEELFTQLRVRSEKQVSCMLDKQCLILRPNDWALKTQGRWKILRKKEERDSFLKGKLTGEVFVLDRIEAKGMTKSVSGHYFSAGRSQMVPIEFAQKPSLQKGAGKKR